MTEDVRQLISDTIELTGAAPPSILHADAPVFTPTQRQIYLIGLVGGKDVGKSSLVNALAGRDISAATSFGPGTQSVIAYAHASAENELRELLEREVPGRFSIVSHNIESLRRQVLLDLPDIDSRYGDHVQITRRMLRHMLYPLWIQSIEKYADRRPQELLAAVAEGNDPANFVFCLNKADQLLGRETESAAEELRQDYAQRIARTLSLATVPQVYLISATRPEQFDLPNLREMFARERSDSAVNESRSLAQRRQDRSLLGWLSRQRLDERAQQLARLETDAEQMLSNRVALPLLERAIPAMIDDPGMRMTMLGPATKLRMSRWPIVNAIDALLSPLLALVQKNLSASPTGSGDPDAYLGGGSVSSMVQATFAQLHQLDPQLGGLYADRKLWEPLHADLAAADLRLRFAKTIEQQRQAVLERAAGRIHVITAPFRWLLTIGAVLWFPIVQPILAVMLQRNVWSFSREAMLTVVNVLSVSHLLQCVTFLLLWFLILWALLRWSTHRRISRLIERWKIADGDEELSLAGQTLQWARELLDPIHHRRQRVQDLLDRARRLDEKFKDAAAPSAA